MKIHTGNSSRFFGSQIQAIEQGFVALGHEVTPHIHLADCVYQNNAPYTGILADKAAGRLKPGAKVILNVLDIPEHLFPHFNLDELDGQLWQADAVTCISQFVQGQLLRHLARKDVPVIYQPAKSVRRQRDVSHPALQKPEWRFMHCGRRSDPNKRASLGAAAIQLLGYTQRDLLLVGNEPGWGDYRGVLDDRGLEIAYNCVDFVFALGRIEGLSLTPIEAMAAGVVPVVCRDLSTLEELFPCALFPEMHLIEPHPESIALWLSIYLNDESGVRLANLKARLHDHYLKHWQEKTSPEGVARRILAVYDSLT